MNFNGYQLTLNHLSSIKQVAFNCTLEHYLSGLQFLIFLPFLSNNKKDSKMSNRIIDITLENFFKKMKS